MLFFDHVCHLYLHIKLNLSCNLKNRFHHEDVCNRNSIGENPVFFLNAELK